MKVKKVGELTDYTLWSEKLTWYNAWKNRMSDYSLKTKLRFFLDYLFGKEGAIYYLKKDTEFIGYCVVMRGGSPRYFFCRKEDIIIGPYCIREDMRGKGLSEVLLSGVIQNTDISFENAYDYIRNTNIPSIKCSEKCGMKKVYTVRISEKLRYLKEDEKGEYGVYRYSKVEPERT